MAIVYRTDDLANWGSGVGRNLNPSEVDGNFWYLWSLYSALETSLGTSVVSISGFTMIGGQFTVELTNGHSLGPYTLPVLKWNYRGVWEPTTYYDVSDVVSEGNSAYTVQVAHTSAASFDPLATDGSANELYALLVSIPGALPTGGAPGQFLMKTGTANYSVSWGSVAVGLGTLNDVVLTSPLNDGELLVFTGTDFTNAPFSSLGAKLSDLADIILTSPLETGHLLVYNAATGAFTSQPKIDMLVVGPTSASGSLALDYGQGEVQRVILAGDTILTVGNWPAPGLRGYMMVEVENPSTYVLNLPFAKWPNGVVPTPTLNGTDIFVFLTWDGGASVYASAVGQNYS